MTDFISRVRRSRAARKVVPVTNSNIRHQPSSLTILSGSRKLVRKVIFVGEQNVVLAASDEGKVCIYDLNTNGQPKAVFHNHNGSVMGLAQLDTDLVASVSYEDDLLLTWRVSNIEQVGQWKHGSRFLTAVAKLDHSRIVVGDYDGGITVLKHTRGTSFQVEKTIKDAHYHWVHDIAVHQTVFFTCSKDKTALVWDANTFQVRATLKHNQEVHSVTITDEHIITASWDNRLRIFENANNFSLQFVLSIPQAPCDIQVLDHDIIAVANFGGSMDFLSLSQKSFLSRAEISHTWFPSFVVLSDARIAFGCDGLACIFSPPSQVQHAVRSCATRLYPSSTLAIQSVHPLRAAWHAVQNGTLSLSNACTNVITPANCKRSLDEWCVAHNLLMLAIESGEIPSSRHFNGIEIHWHIVLYQHCANLAIGEKDINFLVSLFRQAEDAGVIATGGAETLVDIIGVRRDIVAGTRLITNAIYQLFLRQAELDVRLKEVLHYQRVQQLTSLINAVVGCIPIGGAIATNIVSGGASVLNDFQVCGLVESLMGSGKDFGALGSDYFVDRFVRRSNQVLSVQEWSKLSIEQRKVVEDAALNLGLTVDELRDRLEHFAEMQQTTGEKPATTVIIEEVDSSMNINSIGQNTNLLNEGGQVCAADEQEVIRASPEIAPDAATRLSDELRQLKGIGVQRDAFEEMNSKEIASAVAAFLVMYDPSNTERYTKIRSFLSKHYTRKSVDGTVLVDADGEVQKSLEKVTVEALSESVDEDELKFLSVQFQKFLRLVAQ